MTYAEHIREIENVGKGATTGRDPLVVQSWLRCLEDYRMDPSTAREAVIVTDTLLREHRQQAEELVSIARSGIDRLYRQIAAQNYVLLLSDSKGVTVEFFGDATFNNGLRKAGLYLGSEWSEPRAGTCAVGACIATGEALTIHQTDHFDITHTPLSCTAAPIYDMRGELTAVLDISLLSSPVLKASQNMAQHLVSSTARRIELANLMSHSRHDLVLRFAAAPEFLDVDPEAAISIDGSGRVTGMTNGGARLLASAVGRDWRRPDDLLGQPVSTFFDMAVDDIASLTRSHLPRDRRIRTRDGAILYGHAIEPQNRIRSHAKPASANVTEADLMRGLGGDTSEMTALRRRVSKLAVSALPILVQGETGSGKEYMARLIHEISGAKGRFIAVNCAAIPESLIESELFGYAPGSFTGALAKGRQGLIAEADGGTLFLDEIGDMPLTAQSRLLRVLSEREVVPVGGSTPRKVDFRLLSASHRSLPEMVATGSFRQDLYYRLNAAILSLPALRERSDLAWLVERLLRKRGAETLKLSEPALTALLAHSWPGNIRELENAIDFASAVCDGGLIEISDLPEGIGKSASADAQATDQASLEALLADCNGNVSEAARRLSVDRSTLHRKMRRLGVGRLH